jgi:ABC-2 type transport system permease protein
MNMYLHELKTLRKSTIIWTLAIIAVVALYLSLYPSITKDPSVAIGFKNLLAKYPAYVLAGLGISLDSITSLLGFYTMVMAFVTLLGAIQAMNIGVSIISKEMRERTADFLLVKPVSRMAIVSSKLLSALTMLLATDVIFFAAASILASIVNHAEYSNKTFLFFMINLTLLFIQLIFLAIGILISVILPKIKSVLPISLGIVFAFYFIGAIFVTSTNDWTRFISPFKYFDISYIIKNASYQASYCITGAVIVVVAIVASYIIYSKKDIHAVN